MTLDITLPCCCKACNRTEARSYLVIPIAERLCRKRSCEFPGSGFKITYLHEWLNTWNQLMDMVWSIKKKIWRSIWNFSLPETEYGVEAYWDCPRSDYRLVLYLAPHTFKKTFAVEIGAECDQTITDLKCIHISFIRA